MQMNDRRASAKVLRSVEVLVRLRFDEFVAQEDLDPGQTLLEVVREVMPDIVIFDLDSHVVEVLEARYVGLAEDIDLGEAPLR